MIGIYLNEIESDLMIPLLINKINDIYFNPLSSGKVRFNQIEELEVYQEVLGRIYSAKKIGNLSVE